MKKKTKIILAVIGVILLLVVLGIGSCVKNISKSLTAVTTQPLTKTDLQRSVEADGTVSSTVTEQVSNASGIPVWDVDVVVGSYVDRGDRLCRLHVEGNDVWESVTATISGTITAINAVNGSPAAGVLFTIQDTGSLQVNMKLKEADVSKVAVGMPVTITTDATGDKTYSGSITNIAPAADSAATGTSNGQNVATSTKPEFAATVRIESPVEGLLIGMKSKQKIVVEEKQGIFTVPFDAIVKNAQSETGIYTVNTDEKGATTAKWLPVTTGIQNDFAIEITGEGLSEGLGYIASPVNLTDGQVVTLANPEATTDGQAEGAANGQ